MPLREIVNTAQISFILCQTTYSFKHSENENMLISSLRILQNITLNPSGVTSGSTKIDLKVEGILVFCIKLVDILLTSILVHSLFPAKVHPGW